MRVNPFLGMFSRLAARRLQRQTDLAPQRHDAAAPAPVVLPAAGYWARALFNPRRGTRWFHTMTKGAKSRPAKYKGTRIAPGEHGDHQEASVARLKGRAPIEPVPSTDPLDLPMRPEPVSQRRTDDGSASAARAHLEQKPSRALTQAAPDSLAASKAKRERAQLAISMLRQSKKLGRITDASEASFA
jgi:hypothetical protein